MQPAPEKNLVVLLLMLTPAIDDHTAAADVPTACAQIRAACRSAGFVLGGKSGKRMIDDCVKPLLAGDASPGNASRPLPELPVEVVAACRGARGVDEAQTPSAPPEVHATAVAGQLFYDSRLKVTWLTDANLAAGETFGVQGIHRSGSMDYATALRWVGAMNAYNHGLGYLGHNTWQLPTTPQQDGECARTGRHGEPFGFGCSGSTLGSLYYRTLGLHEPASAVPSVSTRTGPFHDFQPYLYWSLTAAADPKQGFISFSFATGFQGANVWRNYLYVLPMICGGPPGEATSGSTGLQPSADGTTIYDPQSRVTWLADANLAATQTFGLTGIARDGAMDHETALRWVEAMNGYDHGRGYLGQIRWQLPDTGAADPTCSMKGTTGFECTGSPFGKLYYTQLGLHRGEPAAPPAEGKIGPLHHLQPYLYWACSGSTAQSHCEPNGPAAGFEWNFSFGNGFQGTNLVKNDLYVIVYFPGAPGNERQP